MNPVSPAVPLLSPEARADIQGFVTSGFGHLPHTAYSFVRFGEPAAARRWLGQLAPAVTTATTWRAQAGTAKQKPVRTLNLAFTAAGLRALGLPATCLATFPSAFLEGVAAPERALRLGDIGASAPEYWELGGPENPAIHAVVIASAETPAALQADCERLDAGIGACAVGVSARELGERPASRKEPFGFRDGVAQPQIRGIVSSGLNAGEFLLGYVNEYGFHPVSPLLRAADDPRRLLPDSANPHHPGSRDFGRNGTFVVYRKLHQDVAAFWRFLESESVRRRGLADPRFMISLAAKMVGRWPGGAPLTVAPERDDPAFAELDDFGYAQADAGGLRCPFGAHVRRMNPRDQLGPAGREESLHMTARHRILRRGRAYGSPLFDLSVLDRPQDSAALRAILDLRDDGQARGLHFLCVNASIVDQFEFIQQVWANNPHFNGLTDNRDPLIGNHGEPDDTSSMHVPAAGVGLRTVPLPPFVTVRGGAYLFMPGLGAIRYLAAI